MALPSPAPQAETPGTAAPSLRFLSLRGISLVISVAMVAAAQVDFASPAHRSTGWWWALGAVVAAAFWQFRLVITDWTQSSGRQWGVARQWWRLGLGALLAIGGAALWVDGTLVYAANWYAGFDRGWLSWVGGAATMSLGFRILQAPRSPARNRLGRWEWMVLFTALAVAAVFRLANYDDYPPQDGVSQVEELQAGQFGNHWLLGDRTRWEFIGQAWLGALSLTLGGPTLKSVRMAYSIVAFLKVVPAYFWFRALAGPAGAMTGTALLAFSGWDTIVNRIPGQHDGLVALMCLALLAGPAVRGAWFVYPWIGLLTGYTIYTYVAYRPLIPLVIAGVVIANLARLQSGRWLPWLRTAGATALVLAMLTAMFIPLTHRLQGPGQFQNEYFNGWNRAHAIEPYYGPHDSWTASAAKRWDRIQMAAALYFIQGDSNPLHNAGGRPLIDPTTGALLIFGVGFCALWWWRGFYGIAFAAFTVTFIGTLVATGNFDVLRCASTIPHVYALAAIGAGGLWVAADRSFGRIGREAVAIVLLALVLWAGYWNALLLRDLWTSPVTRASYRYDLAFLSEWLRRNAAGQRVIGLIPFNAAVVFQDNDGSWLRGPDVHGESTWDVNATLRKLRNGPDPIMVLLFSDTTLKDQIAYFEDALPGVRFRLGPKDPTDTERLAYATVNAPSDVTQSERTRQALCGGLRARWQFRRADGSAIASFAEIVPFIERSSWPGVVRAAAERYERAAETIDASWDGEFTLPEGGPYIFLTSAYDGTVTTSVDGVNIPTGQETLLRLTAGPHRFAMHGTFRNSGPEPTARVWWKGPGTANEMRLLPFYRLTTIDEECAASLPSTPPAAAEPLAAGAP